MKTTYACWIAGLAALVALGAFGYAVDHDERVRVFYGPTVNIGNGTVRTFVKLGADGTPVSIGLTLTEDALTGLPTAFTVYDLALPPSATPFDHVLLDWQPQGHEPEGVYTHPHFDFHFYTISREERMRITAGPDETEVPARHVPRDYFSTVESIADMGVHWVDSTARELHGHHFDRTLIYGFYKGKMVFVEPMITKAFLEVRPYVSDPIKQPAAFERPGLYPLRYSVRYDAEEKAYVVSLDDLSRNPA